MLPKGLLLRGVAGLGIPVARAADVV
jgi:hypothetical protein